MNRVTFELPNPTAATTGDHLSGQAGRRLATTRAIYHPFIEAPRLSLKNSPTALNILGRSRLLLYLAGQIFNILFKVGVFFLQCSYAIMEGFFLIPGAVKPLSEDSIERDGSESVK